MKKQLIGILILFFLPSFACGESFEIQCNEVLEITLESSRHYDNPYREIELDLQLTGPAGQKNIIPGYWDGDDRWKVRLGRPIPGEYTFRTVCSDRDNDGLSGKTGTISIRPYDGPNPLLKHGALKIGATKNIVHADGTPFLWLADSWWHGMTSRFKWPEDFQTLTKDRKDKGFSVIQFAIGFPCDITEFDPRGANEAGFPTSQDYRRINPAYFDLVDLRVQHLVDQGMVPNILGTWGYYLPWFGQENMLRYWRYVIARYGAYPVTWTVAGETTLTYYLLEPEQKAAALRMQRDGWAEVARYIKKTDPFQRILTAHPGPSSGGFQPISDMSPLDIIMVQPGHRGWDDLPDAIGHLKMAQEKFPDRPVMQGEISFEGMHGGGSDAKLQRLLFWTNMLSGAAGHCYGADAIWQFNTEDELFGASPSGHIWGNFTWEEAHQWKGSSYVGLGRKILRRFDWHRFECHPEWVEPVADESDVQGPYAAGISGEIRLFYFPRGLMPWGRRATIRNLDRQSVYEASFIDPMTGDEYPIKEAIENTEQWRAPPAPILQDWLLVLRKQISKPRN